MSHRLEIGRGRTAMARLVIAEIGAGAWQGCRAGAFRRTERDSHRRPLRMARLQRARAYGAVPGAAVTAGAGAGAVLAAGPPKSTFGAVFAPSGTLKYSARSACAIRLPSMPIGLRM
jgi:hypothetical protein